MTTPNPLPPRANRIADLLARLLDRGYAQAARTVIGAYERELRTGALSKRLAQLDAETARLAGLGEKIAADNPVLRALIADLEDALNNQRSLINAASGTLTDSGVQGGIQAARQLALPIGSLPTLGVIWNRPSTEAIAAVVEITSRPEWREMLDRYEQGISEAVRQIALRGIIEGKGPVTIGREVRAAVEGMPRSAAAAIMRTTQMTAYRQATTASYMANADILEPQAIRVAALDARTCMACVALHGTLVPLDQPISEHWNGRCTTVAQVRGRRRVVQTGEDWFGALSEAQQRAQMGQAAYEAWRAGALRLADLVQKRSDPIFGEMIQQASLRGILGDGAKEFYKRRDAK